MSLFAVLEEGGVKMKLTVIDTPGFGDQINNENWWVLKRALNTDNVGLFLPERQQIQTIVNIMQNICSELSLFF